MFVAGNCHLHLLSKLIQAVKSDHGLFAFLVLHIGENIIGSILHGHTRLFLESLEADKVIPHFCLDPLGFVGKFLIRGVLTVRPCKSRLLFAVQVNQAREMFLQEKANDVIHLT